MLWIWTHNYFAKLDLDPLLICIRVKGWNGNRIKVKIQEL
jgi:hypothetical protein